MEPFSTRQAVIKALRQTAFTSMVGWTMNVPYKPAITSGVARCCLALCVVFAILLPHEYFAAGGVSSAAIVGFAETFSGSGEYSSANGRFHGLDNPRWQIRGDGAITEGGYAFHNLSVDPENAEIDRVATDVFGVGSFREEVTIRNLDLGEVPYLGSPDAGGGLRLSHQLGVTANDFFGLVMLENSDTEPEQWTLVAWSGDRFERLNVARGENVSLGIEMDYSSRVVWMSYDSNIDDEGPPAMLGPFEYSGILVDDEHVTEVYISATGTGKGDGIIERWELSPISDLIADFNGNGILDAADIDQLSEQVRVGSSDPLYDLNTDALVDDLDRQFWVHDLKCTYFGDADLNGMFDSTDLVQVLAFGEYEDDADLDSTWLTGDWDGDGEFTSGDLVVALADGGYEAGPRAAVVPEPVGIWLATVAALFVVIRRQGCSETRWA